MAESQSGSPLREAEGKRTMPGPGKALLNVVRGFSLVQNKEHDPEGSHYRVGKWAA